MATHVAASSGGKSTGMASTDLKKNLILCSMTLPGLIWLILIRYLPMFGIIVSFKDFKLPSPRATNIISDIFSREWVGLDNFGQLFSSPTTWQFMKNTIVYNAIFIVLGLVLAVAFAILISELTTKFLAKTYQTLMFFPYFLSWVVVSYFVWAFLSPTAGLWRDGFVNSLGMSAWYNDAKPWPFILVIANLWKNTGYSCILYLAAITGIDTSQYEAARIDGANKWQQIWHITLPHLRTIIIILFIMNVGRIFNADFGLFYQVPRGGAGALTKATEVVDTYVYKMLKDTINIGVSTAVGFFQNIVGFVCIMVANTIVRKVDPDSAMF